MKVRKHGGVRNRNMKRIKEDLERKNMSMRWFWEIERERPIEWDEDREIMQKTKGRAKNNINTNPPTILEENEEKESDISTTEGPNLEGLELVQNEQSGTIKDREGIESKF